MIYWNTLIEKLVHTEEYVIYGAGLVAYEVAFILMGEPYRLNPVCFLVSDRRGNPDHLLGLPVFSLEEETSKIDKNVLIVTATMEKYLNEICENLHRNGYYHILPITFESDLWSLIRGNAYWYSCLSTGKKYRTLEEELKEVHVPAELETAKDKEHTVRVYTARCHMDRPLKEDLSRYHWEIPIQVGAALTTERICDLQDNQGDNISWKNRQYCELTALYWIWKHDSSRYVGLCHYRRHFELDEEGLKKLAYSDIDVVLTIPIVNVPDVEAVYWHDHVGQDWDMMMEALRTLAPEYTEQAQKLAKGNFYYGYNMVIARKEILDDYCAWLFPVLQYCEERCGVKDDTYQERYSGFLAERLLGIYFLKHEDTFKIVHARKHFAEE